MKIIVTIIPTDLVKNLLLPSFFISCKPKTRIWFSANWWSGNEKYFCFLFIASGMINSERMINSMMLHSFEDDAGIS